MIVTVTFWGPGPQKVHTLGTKADMLRGFETWFMIMSKRWMNSQPGLRVAVRVAQDAC